MQHEQTKKTSENLITSDYAAINSPDHSPFDSICSVMQERVYGTQEATG